MSIVTMIQSSVVTSGYDHFLVGDILVMFMIYGSSYGVDSESGNGDC